MISFLKLVQEFELHQTLSSQTKVSDRLKGESYVTIERLICSSVLSCNFMVDGTSYFLKLSETTHTWLTDTALCFYDDLAADGLKNYRIVFFF